MDEEYEECERQRLSEKIAALAASYTPEWRYDAAHPDAGTALALIFQEMFLGTCRRFERIPEKQKYAFFEWLGLTMRPASAAGGYVTFGLSGDEFGGVFLKKGVAVSGAANAEGAEKSAGSHVTYETQEAVYVTPAKLTQVLFVDGARDYIARKDFSGPFAPFARQEKNLQEHAFYLCQDEVLHVSGPAEVRLRIEQPDAAQAEVFPWMLDEGQCSFSYGTADGFAEYGSRREKDGALILQIGENGEKPESRELFGKKGYWLCCRYKKAWCQEPFEADDIRIGSGRERMEPDLIWNQTGEQENERMYPFGDNPLPFAECYFASAEALGKPGARIGLSFRLDYEKIPFDNSVKPDRRWKLLMRRADFIPDPEYDITVAQVVWEYYNGTGWSRLMLGKKWETLFDGTGARAGQQVYLEFTCPSDAALLEWQAAPTRYLRIRILRMTNLYKPKGVFIVPVIGEVRFAYDYGREGRPPSLIAAVNNLEQRVFCMKENSPEPVPFPLLCGQKEERPSLYLGFHLPLSAGPIRFLFAMQEEVRGSLPLLRFSYSGRHGFADLSVVDKTEGFKKSGTLTLMGKADFAESAVCGETAYWVRITDERAEYRTWDRQRRMPRILGIYLNAARILAGKRQAQESPGTAANQMPGSVTRLCGAYGYVSRVTNPLPIGGGCGAETPAEALRRGSAALWHRGRAVTASDFEALAREASRAVKKVACCPNCNAQGRYEPGAVTVVLMPEEFEKGSLYSAEVRRQVETYLSERMSGNPAALGRLYVVDPVFLEMDCYVEAVVRDRNRIFEIQEEITETGRRFLHPLTGNYDGNGWEIGAVPNETQMINALKGIPGLLYIRSLRLFAYRNFGGERARVSLGGRDRARFEKQGGQMIERFAVPLPGRFEIAADAEQGAGIRLG